MPQKNPSSKRRSGSQSPTGRGAGFKPSLLETGHQGNSQPFQLVSARWLITWFFGALLFAAACAYLAMCFLFYQGQWQVIFHASSSVAKTPASAGIPFDDVRFDYTETGQAQLDGWWIPVGREAASQTILYLHGADGSLSDTLGALKALHSLGANLLAIDYRGFGQSMATHPSEQRVYQDADAAFAYLTEVRHIDPRSVVVYGQGLGATIAAELARRHTDIAGLVLDDPAPSGLTLIERDRRTGLIPVGLLFQDRFELTPKLNKLDVPKLIIEGPATNYFPAAAGPKELLLPPGQENHAGLPQVASFLHAHAAATPNVSKSERPERHQAFGP